MLKLGNANILAYTSHFMEMQQKDNETLTAYVYHFKTTADQCAFNYDIVVNQILLGDFGMCTPPQLRFMRRTLKLCLKSSE